MFTQWLPKSWRTPSAQAPGTASNAVRSFPSTATFRLQGIPASISGEPTSPQDISQLVGKAWNSGCDVPLNIHSLATDPYYGEMKVATLTFQQAPSFLSPKERVWKATFEAIDDQSVSLTLDLDFFGFTPFHSTPEIECTVDIIALCDLDAHAFSSFQESNPESSFMWLRDALPMHFPQARIYTYGYDTRLVGSKSFEEIPDLGLKFRDAMSNIRSEPSRELILVGHGLGGVMVKEAIIQLKDTAGDGNEACHIDAAATLKSISGLLFFGTPNQGLDNKALKLMVKDQPNEILVINLGQSSGVLRTQMDRFRRVFEESNFLTFWYYETEKTPTPKQSATGEWVMTGECRTLVDKTSATSGVPSGLGRYLARPIPKDHYGMVKLQGIHDTVYKLISGDLTRVISHA